MRRHGAGLWVPMLLLGACGGERVAITAVDPPAAAVRDAGDVALVRDHRGDDLLVAWVGGATGSRHVWFARSPDDGASWSEPTRVTSEPDDVGAPHGESAPRLVSGGDGRVAIVWSRSVPVPGRRFPASMIRFSRSLDGGATWSPVATLNDDSTAAPGTHTFHGAVLAGGDRIVAAWLDERGAADFTGHHHDAGNPDAAAQAESDARIFMTSSPDFGGSWEPNRAVWGAVCPCCRVALARDAAGGVRAAWRQHFPGSVRDVVTAPLTPSPGEPARVYRDDWEYPGCPHTGPALAIDSADVRHVVWYTGRPGGAGVYYGRLAPGADAVEAPAPVVTGSAMQTAHSAILPLPDGGALVATDVGEDGARAIRLARFDSAGALVGARTADGSAGGSYPQLAGIGPDAALVAWTEPAGDGSRLRMARVSLAP